MEQLPKSVQHDIKFQFLYKHFFLRFRNFFRIKNMAQNRYYCMADEHYVDFIQSLVNFMEPRSYFKGITVNDEGVEVLEILFLNKGQIAVGFEVNHNRHFCLGLGEGSVVGEYPTVFDCTSEFIFETISNCECISIRQINLK